MKHVMMLSDLYGRIGQMLAEHGDAPIGHIKTPMFPEGSMEIDWIEPMYCTFTHVTNEIQGVKIKTYEPVID